MEPDARPLTSFSEPARSRALDRFTQLRPHLEDGVPLTRLAQEHQVPLRTVQRWLQAYQQHGLSGLARRRRSDRSTRTFPPELLRLIEGLALRTPPPSTAFVHRQV